MDATRSRSTRPGLDPRLLRLYQRNGCLRMADPARRAQEGEQYHKGYEVRIILYTAEELALVRTLILDAGLKPGRPYKRRGDIVQPVYGRKAVERFVIAPFSRDADEPR